MVSAHLPLSPKNYLSLIKNSFVKPKSYIAYTSQYSKTKDQWVFFIMNIVVGLALETIIALVYYQTPTVIFQSITEIALFIPVASLFLIITTLILHSIAKALKGQGDFRTSLQAVSFSTTPLIFYWIPYVRIISFPLIIFFLILEFRNLHHYSTNKAIANILIPSLILALMAFLLGVTSSSIAQDNTFA